MVFFCIMFCCGVSRGDDGTMVVFDNFGPNDTVSNGGAWFGTLPGGSWDIVASSVVPSASGPLAKLTCGMRLSGYPGPFSNEFVLMLCDDANDEPGEVLSTWTFTDKLPPAASNQVTTLTEFGSAGPWLQAGHKYWFEARTPSGDSVTFHIWWAGLAEPVNSVAHMNGFFYPNWDVADNVPGWSMRVEVLPETHTTMLAVFGFGLTGRRRRTP
jgi:hypothetical protein